MAEAIDTGFGPLKLRLRDSCRCCSVSELAGTLRTEALTPAVTEDFLG